MAEWTISLLDKSHLRDGFSSGKEPLDAYLRTLVTQYQKRRLGQTHVATEIGSTRVAGYYTLAASGIDVSILPANVRRKLPKHPVPAIHLGRLAVDQAFRGCRLGEVLLFHALETALELSMKIGVFAVDVWAIDDEASAFYQKYGFIALEDDPHHLYLLMQTVAGMFGD